MRKRSNKLPSKPIEAVPPFLNREHAYLLHAEMRVNFEDYLQLHKNNTDEPTFKKLQTLVHDIITFYTIKEK